MLTPPPGGRVQTDRGGGGFEGKGYTDTVQLEGARLPGRGSPRGCQRGADRSQRALLNNAEDSHGVPGRLAA
jgi:hypothetical protein